MLPADRRRFWSGRTVAVTGASGFVGWHVAAQLAGWGAQVTALVRGTSNQTYLQAAGIPCVVAELGDGPALARACRGCEVVFHLAGAVDFRDDWQRCRESNVAGTRRLLEAARQAGVRRCVHVSSIVAVGASARPGLLDESAVWNLGQLRIPYVTTKREAEECALQAAGPDLEVVVVNPTCVVGPNDFAGSEFGTLCRRFWQGRVPCWFGGGNNFVDVRDVADGVLRSAERGANGHRYILGGSNRTYGAFFADLARAAGRPIWRVRLPSWCAVVLAELEARFGSPRARPTLTPAQAQLLPWYFHCDSGKAQRELGYAARPLALTLADAYRFWLERRGRLAAFRFSTHEVASWNRQWPAGPASASASPAAPAFSAGTSSGSSSRSAAG